MTVALVRFEAGNLSNAKSVGGGVLEYRIDYGPGYRVYFGRDSNGISRTPHARWLDYKRRKRGD